MFIGQMMEIHYRISHIFSSFLLKHHNIPSYFSFSDDFLCKDIVYVYELNVVVIVRGGYRVFKMAAIKKCVYIFRPHDEIHNETQLGVYWVL